MRLLGKRMSAQLNKNEMIAMTTLAAAIGVPIQAPDRGLLPPVIIAAIVVLAGRLIARWACRSQRFENLSQDKVGVLVEDSTLKLDELHRSSITRERLFAYLRSQGATHLGQINRVYFEAGGFFTIVRQKIIKPGLSIIPSWDTDLMTEQPTSHITVCQRCGTYTQNHEACAVCNSNKYEQAIAGDGYAP